jgi:DNA invertase Pin-like site-specific DNA recombinase
MSGKPFIRCAIYTRKSSEEGLEQSFNSLHAQREACEAYIKSQKHEGWHALSTHYDDGGFSGGSMERPGLQSLLADIAAGKINIVVVYKVDRLTRSLLDFSKIIQSFDDKGVSFVSVTQQFNTTTSMGRLTLNVLLSFAQFEREVTGERIRDKIAASKKKGMWMGGFVPLGYEAKDRQLIIIPEEAETVREIFRQYLTLGRVSALKRHLDDKNIRSKLRTNASGVMDGAKSYSRGALYHLLNNRIYVGEIAHRDNVYPGQHAAIIDRETWDKVAALLAQNNQGNRLRGKSTSGSLLTGVLFDAAGNRYTPTHAVKNGKRYRYYTSQAVIRGRKSGTSMARIPAREVEHLVQSRILSLLSSPTELSSLLTAAGLRGARLRDVVACVETLAARLTKMQPLETAHICGTILKRVIVTEGRLTMEIKLDVLLSEICGTAADGQISHTGANSITIDCEYQARQWSNELRLVSSGEDVEQPTPLLMSIARARLWYEQIVAGEIYNFDQLAERYGFSAIYASRIFRWALLPPSVVETALRTSGGQEISRRTPYSAHCLDWGKSPLPPGSPRKRHPEGACPSDNHVVLKNPAGTSRVHAAARLLRHV